MRHFDFLGRADADRLFLREPEPFAADDDLTTVGAGLGATLYCPATRSDLARDVVRRRAAGAMAVVICLEDSVPDPQLADAERNAVASLATLADVEDELPMVFVRVRAPEQIPMLIEGMGRRHRVLTGFVLPKFEEDNGDEYLSEVVRASSRVGRRLLAMPVLETPSIAHAETRVPTLLGTKMLVDKHREHVPTVRIGATDISGAYGLRRAREITVWDVRVVADALTTIINVFGREDGGYAISGPVWEYFPSTERMFKPQLRETPFIDHAERSLRAELLASDLDGLIREVVLDRANGLTGKTVIHPMHVAAVNALSVVTAEEFADAGDILATEAKGGAAASSFRNKMNESKPHTTWARRVMVRARVFGVSRTQVSFVDLLGASLHR